MTKSKVVNLNAVRNNKRRAQANKACGTVCDAVTDLVNFLWRNEDDHEYIIGALSSTLAQALALTIPDTSMGTEEMVFDLIRKIAAKNRKKNRSH